MILTLQRIKGFHNSLIDCLGAIDHGTVCVQLLGLLDTAQFADGTPKIFGLCLRQEASTVDAFSQQFQFIEGIRARGYKIASLL